MNELAIECGIKAALVLGTVGASFLASRLTGSFKRHLVLLLLVSSCSFAIWTVTRQTIKPEKSQNAQILNTLGIKRAFTSEDLRKTRRSARVELHPDLQTSDKQDESLLEFQKKENLFEMLADPVKRELVDRFTFTEYKATLDQDLLRQISSNLTMNELTMMLPRSSPWLIVLGTVILKAPAQAAKPLLNLLVFKLLWELYLLVLQPVPVADIMDLILPRVTLAERRELVDFFFVVPFSLALLYLVFVKPEQEEIQAGFQVPEVPSLRELLQTLRVSAKLKAN